MNTFSTIALTLSKRGRYIGILALLVIFSGLLSEEESIGSLWKEKEKEERSEEEVKEKDSVCAISFSSFVEKASGNNGQTFFYLVPHAQAFFIFLGRPLARFFLSPFGHNFASFHLQQKQPLFLLLHTLVFYDLSL